jgi:UDP-3-O-acyl N-acetylglucosamine deacetylase
VSSPPLQRSITRPLTVEGRGLHTGTEVRVRLLPAGPDDGIRFRRTDLDSRPIVSGTVENAVAAERRTELRSGGATVHTVEHLLAAAASLPVDNLLVELNGAEPPALDGSAGPWVRALKDAGIREQGVPARVGVITGKVSLREGDSRYTVSPWDSYRIAATIEFDHRLVGRQTEVAEVDETFETEFALARTFGLARWKDELQARGLALGASTSNTVVLTDRGLAGDTSLRYPNEFVRHKIVDIVGDLALLGMRLRASVMAERPSHRGNLALARELLKQVKARQT